MCAAGQGDRSVARPFDGKPGEKRFADTARLEIADVERMPAAKRGMEGVVIGKPALGPLFKYLQARIDCHVVIKVKPRVRVTDIHQVLVIDGAVSKIRIVERSLERVCQLRQAGDGVRP